MFIDYSYSKLFKTPEEAINEITDISYSLGSSDLTYFIDCKTYDDFYKVFMGLETYAYIEVYEKNHGFYFSYSTHSCTNTFSMDVVILKNGNFIVKAYYSVISDHSIKYSSIATVPGEYGWRMSPLSSLDKIREKMNEEEDEKALKERFVESVVERKRLLMCFDVHFSQYGCVLSQSICTSPERDLDALGLCPYLRPMVKDLALQELDRELVVPDKYDFNDEMYKGGNDSWYALKFKEYKAGIRQLLEACG